MEDYMNYFKNIEELIVENEANKKANALRDNSSTLQTYWNIGKLIVEAQGGEKRAKYGDNLIKEWGKKLSEKYGKGYDNCWVIDGAEPGQLQTAAELYAPESGRLLEVITTQPGVQVYTGNWLAGCPEGKCGRSYNDYDGVAIECQHFPDSPNHPDYPSTVLRPGETFEEAIVFVFKVK